MGDMLSFIEKAESSLSLEKAQALEKKLRKDEFTLDDFLDQLQQVRNLGPLDQLLKMLPGMGQQMKQLKDAKIDENQIKQTEAIIRSMTKKERRDPSILNGGRRERIASGSGTRVQDVNRLLKQFDEAKKMMKRFQGMPKGKAKPGGFNLPFMK